MIQWDNFCWTRLISESAPATFPQKPSTGCVARPTGKERRESPPTSEAGRSKGRLHRAVPLGSPGRATLDCLSLSSVLALFADLLPARLLMAGDCLLLVSVSPTPRCAVCPLLAFIGMPGNLFPTCPWRIPGRFAAPHHHVVFVARARRTPRTPTRRLAPWPLGPLAFWLVAAL